jgi:hypothetical protein
MRSYEKPKSLSKHSLSLPRVFARRKPFSQPPRIAPTDEQASRIQLAMLVQEHRDLDAAISALFEAKIGDPLLITRMKKRKLQIKDEIALIEG